MGDHMGSEKSLKVLLQLSEKEEMNKKRLKNQVVTDIVTSVI